MAFQKKISNIIFSAYGKRYRLRTPREAVVMYPGGYAVRRSPLLERFRPFWDVVSSHKFITIFLLLFTIKTILVVYSYNMLVDAQQNMMASHSNMDALLQRRNDIANNLSKAVADYSQYEQAVFTSVVSLRTFMNGEGNSKDALLAKLQGEPPALPGVAGKPALPAPLVAAAPVGGSGLLSSLSKLMAVAEQYPDLKLSANFTTLMAALVEVERDLAAERIKFNGEANVYTTYIRKFPMNIVAMIFGFDDFSYFEASKEAQSFRLIEY